MARFLTDLIRHDAGLAAKKEIIAGLTFSYPMIKTAANAGKIADVTKWLSGATELIGQDPVKLLTEAFQRQKVHNVRITALINDTEGTLLRGGDLGLIVGTGTNLAAAMPRARIAKLGPVAASEPAVMIVNMESGNFDMGALADQTNTSAVRTVYDRALDDRSPNPGKQRFEKMVSGMYLPQIVEEIFRSSPELGERAMQLSLDALRSREVAISFIEFFQGEMARGLAGQQSSLAMHPSHLSLPQPVEEDVLGIDFGGTNLRGLLTHVTKQGVVVNKGRSREIGLQELLGMTLNEEEQRQPVFRVPLTGELRSAVLEGDTTVWAKLGLEHDVDQQRRMTAVCRVVTERSARLTAMAVAASVLYIDSKISRPHTIAVDGSLYEKSPGYKETVEADLAGMLRMALGRDPSHPVTLVLTKDGSGTGAAVAAANEAANAKHGAAAGGRGGSGSSAVSRLNLFSI